MAFSRLLHLLQTTRQILEAKYTLNRLITFNNGKTCKHWWLILMPAYSHTSFFSMGNVRELLLFLLWLLICRSNPKIAFIFTSLSAVHICDFHIFKIIYSPLHGFIWNQHSDQLPVGLLAQLVNHCTGIAEIMGPNPVQAWIFFSDLIFTTAQVVLITAKIAFIFTSLSAVQIYDFLIFTVCYQLSW